MFGPNLLTRKYKNFSLPAEIFASRTFIRKFRKNLDLVHIIRCTVEAEEGGSVARAPYLSVQNFKTSVMITEKGIYRIVT